MSDDSLLPFALPAVGGKKVTVAFDGGRLSSDGGLLLRAVEQRLGIARRLAGCFRNRRDPSRVVHSIEEMLRLRMLAIAAGYEDANDCDTLRFDPVMKMAVGPPPESGKDLCSQPTISRLENAPSRTDAARMMGVMIDLFCDSFPQPPTAITLDIDDTVDEVHGGQQLSLFNAHHDAYCFLPIHVYHAETGRPVAMLLRKGATPSGREVRAVLKRIVGRIRRHWPKTRITIRGDSHYGRPEAMSWCEGHGVDFIFGLSGNAVLDAKVAVLADDLCVRRAEQAADKLRSHAEIRYGAKTWKTERKVVARLEATTKGLDNRYIVTSLPGRAEDLYEATYCDRGKAENFIKLHKSQLASDRTSCRSPVANQIRLILHTAAYWLMLGLRDAIPKAMPLATAQFDTLRLKLIKIAARVIEKATRIRILLPTACPEQRLFRGLAIALARGS